MIIIHSNSVGEIFETNNAIKSLNKNGFCQMGVAAKIQTISQNSDFFSIDYIHVLCIILRNV